MRERHDTVIIGGGQAGLVMSHQLTQRRREHVVLERSRIAERWRTERWESLRFQLPNQWLRLPGKPYKGTDPGGFAHYSDVAQFIEDYAAEISAPVRCDVEVRRLTQADDGYLLETNEGEMTAKHVVLATGPFQRPLRAPFAADIPAFVHQTDATHYRKPAALPQGAVLVVGSGNSGCQIAEELLRSGRRVFLSVSRHTRVPRRYRGRDVIWWYDALGRLDVEITSLPGRRYPPTSIMTGIAGGAELSPRKLGQEGVRLVGRVLGVDGQTLYLGDETAEVLAAADRSHHRFLTDADAFIARSSESDAFGEAEYNEPGAAVFDRAGSIDLRREKVGAIVWATGHGFTLDWVKLPVLDGEGALVQTRGVTACKGVYFLGLHYMHNFRSGILSFVGSDAAYIADHMDRMTRH